MGASQGGRMWASAPTGVTGTRRPGKHTGPPLIPSCRGRRPRRPAFTAREAPAESPAKYQGSASGKRRAGYPGPPRAKGFPKGSAFDEAETRNGQPSPAGGRRYALARTDPPWRFFLLDRPRPVLFLSRTKREWGVESSGDHRIPRTAKRCIAQPEFWLTPLPPLVFSPPSWYRGTHGNL